MESVADKVAKMEDECWPYFVLIYSLRAKCDQIGCMKFRRLKDAMSAAEASAVSVPCKPIVFGKKGEVGRFFLDDDLEEGEMWYLGCPKRAVFSKKDK